MDDRTPPTDDDLLAALAAGELSGPDADALAARVAADDGLRARLDAARATEARLRAEPLLALPVALVGRVVHAVRAEAAPPWERRAADRSPRVPRALRAAAAAVLLAAATATALGGVEPVSAAAATLAAAPVPDAVRDAWPVRPAALRELSRPTTVRSAATVLASGADAVPGGTPTLVLGGAAALGAAALAARAVGRRRLPGA